VIFCNFFYIITESSKNKIDIQYIMGRRSVTKKLLKLKKGGEKKSKRSTRQIPNQQARYPVETKEFTHAEVHPLTSAQIIYGLHNNKIFSIQHNKMESEPANFEIVPNPELLTKLRSKTEKIKKDARKARMKLKKLTGPKTRKSHSSHSSKLSIETGFPSH